MNHLVRHRSSTRVAVGILSVAALTVPAAPASAAAPINDSIDAATPLGTVPATIVEDTSQATGGAADGACVAGASVWFRVRPSATQRVRITTLGSDYDTVLAVFSGPKAHRALIACRDDSFFNAPNEVVQVRLAAGTTYWVAASACCGRRSPGGQLQLRTFRPAPAGLSVTVDSVETGTVSGRLLVHGTVQCNTPSDVELSVSASERVNGGVNVARGSGVLDRSFQSGVSPFTLPLDSESGWAFQVGTVVLDESAIAVDGFEFAADQGLSGTFPVTENPNALRPGHVR